MQITEICNQSSKTDAVGNAYIRQQMSDKCIRSIPASAMACFQDLIDFERGVIVGAREMRHSISEVAMKFGFSRTAISRVNIGYPGTIKSDGASVMVWDVCSWRDMGPLIRLETTLTGDRYLSILSDHLHSFMSIVHSDGLGQFHRDNATPHAPRIATKWLQETLLTLDTSIGHLNPQR
ncbi:hypothetical protein AVEN_128489-1 [Araneus ventricosus]|uniref:Tc3 transposase DNA binding domain-containing protein n=1 Tax=Araneus ventricosus TaxID=182803 RepID=A0A4Y2FU51_ARAVE|nr:hypothetical protein AVEN_128489-1 [Araneus ventricosus]